MNETNLTPLGKLFFASLVAWITNDVKFNWKLKGNPEKIQAMLNAIFASKRFQEESKKTGISVETIIQKLNDKTKAAEEFKNLVGVSWPL